MFDIIFWTLFTTAALVGVGGVCYFTMGETIRGYPKGALTLIGFFVTVFVVTVYSVVEVAVLSSQKPGTQKVEDVSVVDIADSGTQKVEDVSVVDIADSVVEDIVPDLIESAIDDIDDVEQMRAEGEFIDFSNKIQKMRKGIVNSQKNLAQYKQKASDYKKKGNIEKYRECITEVSSAQDMIEYYSEELEKLKEEYNDYEKRDDWKYGVWNIEQDLDDFRFKLNSLYEYRVQFGHMPNADAIIKEYEAEIDRLTYKLEKVQNERQKHRDELKQIKNQYPNPFEQ